MLWISDCDISRCRSLDIFVEMLQVCLLARDLLHGKHVSDCGIGNVEIVLLHSLLGFCSVSLSAEALDQISSVHFHGTCRWKVVCSAFLVCLVVELITDGLCKSLANFVTFCVGWLEAILFLVLFIGLLVISLHLSHLLLTFMAFSDVVWVVDKSLLIFILFMVLFSTEDFI